MEIKEAKNASESTTLAATRQSERYAIALLLGAAIFGGSWFLVPKDIKEKMAPVGAAAAIAVGGVLKLGFVKIKNGRMQVGDLEKTVETMALLPAGQGALLNVFKPVIEGNLKLHELPEVRSIVETAVKEATTPKDIPAPRSDEAMKPLIIEAEQRTKTVSDLAALAQRGI